MLVHQNRASNRTWCVVCGQYHVKWMTCHHDMSRPSFRMKTALDVAGGQECTKQAVTGSRQTMVLERGMGAHSAGEWGPPACDPRIVIFIIFFNIVFKIKHKSYTASTSGTRHHPSPFPSSDKSCVCPLRG